MFFFNLTIISSLLLFCAAQFTDHMQVYEQECLGENKIHCSDGSCIWQHQYCDGKVDCLDGSDENLCADHTPDPLLCTDSHYLCRNGSKCIPTTWLCNNQTDCDDGSDEDNCTTIEPPKNSTCKGFECVSDKRCISSLWICDGKYDCIDHSDENPDTCHHARGFKPLWDQCETVGIDLIRKTKMYRCDDDSFCLHGRYMCNGLHDCKDGSDEGPFCDTWREMCPNKTCNGNSTCFPERKGAVCVCLEAYRLYNETSASCEPMNMCAEARPYCSQECVNKNGPFICKCEEGYRPDRYDVAYVCMATGPEPILFFSTRNEIKYIYLRSKNIVTVVTGIKQAHGVAFDGSNLYWVETAQGHQTIMSAPLNSTSDVKQVLVGLGLEDPGDISIDWIGGNFYFNDAQRGTISACNIVTKICTTIKTDARTPKHLTLDVNNGKMYWADWHDKPVIMSARMDGSRPSVLVGDLESFPRGLSVDSPSGRLYFVDKTLKGVRLDNGLVFPVSEHAQTRHQPYAVAVFENIVYWSDWVSNSIQRWEKLSGNDQGVIALVDSPIYGMSVYHPVLMKPKPVHQKWVNICSHLRLVTSNATSVCACPDGMQLDISGITCHPIQNYRPEYIVVGAGLTFTLVQYNALGNHGNTAVFLDIGRVQAMAYDTFRDTLYIYDARWKTINSIKMSKFSRGTTEMLMYMGLDNVLDMDYDYITDALYFADAGRKSIEVISLKTNKRAIIHMFHQEVPISLCVLPDYGKMLVAVSESEQNDIIHIDSFGLDGSGREHVLVNNLKGPHIKLRYSMKMDRVFIADEGNSIIDHMHPEGTGRETFRELSTSVAQLSVTDWAVVWTARRGARLYWADIHDTSRAVRRAQLAMFTNVSHLQIQATWTPQFVPAHPCQNDLCSDVCVQTPVQFKHPMSSTTTPVENNQGYKCLCPPGLLNVDGKCTELVACEEDEAFCHNSNVCIKKYLLCNGKNDCKHGEDEEGCNYTTTAKNDEKCSPDEKLCDGQCIHKNKVCFSTSAPAGNASPTEERDLCDATQFWCGGTLCVQRSQMCDGVTDCPDGSDEARPLCDTLNCLHTEFMCSSGHCVLIAFRCDGELDCTDGSDETDCGNKTCAQAQYQCRNLECIDVTKRCDAQQDCSDFSDEDDCDYADISEAAEPENCAEWEYTCELNRTICLPLTARCNGKPDCPGNTDEANCDHGCVDGGLRCSQETHCVPVPRICDGRLDCGTGDDETREACEKVNKTLRRRPAQIFPLEECNDGFRCANGQCVEWRSVCDKQPDCADGSDEDQRCLSACEHHNCSATCQPTPLGQLCRCPAGYTLASDLVSCEDLDECAQEVCSQQCYNMVGSFVCSCHHGYSLRSDRRSCKAVKGNMSILYVTGNSVRSITADGQISSEYNDDSIATITDMDYDVRRKMLYFTSAEAGKLVEVNSTKDKVIVTNIGQPSKVVVDWISGNVYFVDRSTLSRMRVCNLQTKRCAPLHRLPPHNDVTALTIDPASKKLFYCLTRDMESMIWSCSLSGRRETHIAVVANCTGLAVDTFAKRLFVAETGPAQIVAMDYDGNMFKKVVTDHPHLQAPHDLAIFEDHIYFLVANSFKLNRCLLYGKKHCETYLQRVFNANSFVIRHESIQRDDIPDYCHGVKCDNICVRGDQGRVCLCDDGSVSTSGVCSLVSKDELPQFNGWTLRDYQHTSRVIITLIVSVAVLTVVYISMLLSYRYYCRRKREENRNYFPVLFRNSVEGSVEATPDEDSEAITPASPATVEISTPGTSTHEFVNPLQMFRNWRASFRKRPIGTAGLEINVPPLDNVSDTESDLDDKDRKKIVKK